MRFQCEKLDLFLALASEYFPEMLNRIARPIVLDSGELVGATADKMGEAFGKILRDKRRGLK